ncbi:hypothetical protein NOVO_06735 [Rickettsiales bacterium Ac37b]|nr:hypothetical protein NOVO_06735 [Rickettsiales bacterium Ac37b]
MVNNIESLKFLIKENIMIHPLEKVIFAPASPESNEIGLNGENTANLDN